MLEAFDPDRHDLVLLDLRLPDEDGTVIARQLRARSEVPIIVLTSVLDEGTRIACLSVGVDDFLLKSISPDELKLRVRNILRRGKMHREKSSTGSDQETLLGWTIDRAGMTVRDAQGVDANLTVFEFKTLLLLLNAKGRILTRDQILDGLAAGIDGPSDRMVDAFISRIRKKLGREDIIKTMRGEGYKIYKE